MGWRDPQPAISRSGLAAAAMLSGNIAPVLAVLQTGLQSPEHQAFVAQLVGTA